MKSPHIPWNKGKVVGQKLPFSPSQVRQIKAMMLRRGDLRDLSLFSVGIDSLLRSSDLLALKVSDVMTNGVIKPEISVRQQKTKRNTIIELQEKTCEVLQAWIGSSHKGAEDYLFTGRKSKAHPISHAHYASLVKKWAAYVGAGVSQYSTHSVRRTMSSIVYDETKNLKACQELLGHASVASTSVYLNVEKRDALAIARKIAKKIDI